MDSPGSRLPAELIPAFVTEAGSARMFGHQVYRGLRVWVTPRRPDGVIAEVWYLSLTQTRLVGRNVDSEEIQTEAEGIDSWDPW